VIDAYWNKEATGQSTSEGGIGLSTSQMTGQSAKVNMNGLDFNEVWKIQATDYPIVSNIPAVPTSSASTQEVTLTNVEINPSVIDDGSINQYTITFRLVNVSADGSPDDIVLTFPQKIDIKSYSGVDIGEVSASDVEKVNNKIKFSVNPNGNEEVENMSGEIDVKLSA
jgi:hypothetical protein